MWIEFFFDRTAIGASMPGVTLPLVLLFLYALIPTPRVRASFVRATASRDY